MSTMTNIHPAKARNFEFNPLAQHSEAARQKSEIAGTSVWTSNATHAVAKDDSIQANPFHDEKLVERNREGLKKLAAGPLGQAITAAIETRPMGWLEWLGAKLYGDARGVTITKKPIVVMTTIEMSTAISYRGAGYYIPFRDEDLTNPNLLKEVEAGMREVVRKYNETGELAIVRYNWVYN